MSPYLLLLPLLILAAVSQAAEKAVAYTPFALEIIQPHAGLDTRNRFYRAYPGLAYSVPVSAIGGVFPYHYALTTAPAGMAINPTTGVITWPTPAAGKVEVTVTVTDAAQAVQQVRWPITVTTEGWLFVDAAAPAGGTGTREAPFKTLLQVYGTKAREGKYSEAHKDHFVVVKNGTYLLDGWMPNERDVQWTYRQPVVFLAYPGHRPTLDLTGRFLFADTALDNFYLDGFDVTPMTAKFGFRLTGASSDVTFWRVRFTDFAESAGSDNQSCIMACAGGDGKRWAVLDCEFRRIHHGYGIIGYTVEKLLVGRSSFTEMDDPTGTSSLPVGPKVDCHRWVIRENRFVRNAVQNVWLYYAQHEGTGNPYGEMEVAYNLIEAGDKPNIFALTINQAAHAVSLPSYVYRNTLVGRVHLFNYAPEYPAMSFRDNVLVGQPRKPDDKTAVVDGIGVTGPASAVQSSGNLTFDTREGHLNPDGSLVKPVPGKGHVIAGLSAQAMEIGRDDFESGALHKPLWIDKAWCEVVDGLGVGGSKAARFRFKGSPDPKKDAWSELRFDLGELRTEVWFAYALFIPQNYRMKRSANNKFFRIWGREYGDADKLGASMWGRHPFDGFARLKGDWDSTGGGMGEAGKGCDGFITAADLGAWMRIMVHIRAATSEAKGTMQIWKNGVLIIDNDGTVNSWKEQGVHAYRYGYLLGAANSGFAEDTDLYIDNVVFGTTRADVEPTQPAPAGGTALR